MQVVIQLLMVVVMVASLWKIFKKAGQPGWAAIVPIYNIIVLLRIADKPLWWVLLMLVPIANIVFCVMMMHAISLKFGKDTAFTVGLVLLGFVFLPILGFGDAQYDASACK